MATSQSGSSEAQSTTSDVTHGDVSVQAVGDGNTDLGSPMRATATVTHVPRDGMQGNRRVAYVEEGFDVSNSVSAAINRLVATDSAEWVRRVVMHKLGHDHSNPSYTRHTDRFAVSVVVGAPSPKYPQPCDKPTWDTRLTTMVVIEDTHGRRFKR